MELLSDEALSIVVPSWCTGLVRGTWQVRGQVQVTFYGGRGEQERCVEA
jgi:hypothetical protein